MRCPVCSRIVALELVTTEGVRFYRCNCGVVVDEHGKKLEQSAMETYFGGGKVHVVKIGDTE